MTETSSISTSTAAQLFAVMRLSRQQLFRNRRTLVFILLGLVTPIFALLFTVVKQMPAMAPPITGWDFFSFLMVTWYLQALLLLVALFYGTHLINSEVEEKTLTYLLIRPVPRPLLVLGKFLTYLTFAIVLLVSSMALTWVISELADGTGGFSRHLPYVLWDAGVLVLGAMAYGALFTLFGTALRRPIMVGLSFVFVWELLVTYIPGRFGKFTIKHYLLSIFPHSTVARGIQNLFQSMTSRPVAVLALLLITGVFLGLAMLLFSRREYVLEQ
jgi:ABC-type transport system involved in multi-copper enzyme maturation permease subunit